MNFIFTLAQYAPYYTESSGYAMNQGSGMYSGISIIGVGLILLAGLIGGIVQSRMQASVKKYSAEPAPLTGAQVARRMLDSYGLHHVQVTHTPGALTDHYNPANHTVNLSDTVYSQATVAAMAVAAHECGHAVQHATAYGPLTLRTALVPTVQIASNWMQWVLLAGILLIEVFPTILLIGIILFALTTLFSFVTLPVEIDASQRACRWLCAARITTPQDQPNAEAALRAAAYTYVVAAHGTHATLRNNVMIFLGSSNDD